MEFEHKRALKTHLFSTARRHWDVLMILAPYINIQTYLLTYTKQLAALCNITLELRNRTSYKKMTRPIKNSMVLRWTVSLCSASSWLVWDWVRCLFRHVSRGHGFACHGQIWWKSAGEKLVVWFCGQKHVAVWESSEPQFCPNWADRTQNFVNVVGPWPVHV